MKKLTWPAWFNGPKGETAVFEAPEDVPTGWTSGAEKQSAKGSPASAPTPAPTPTPTPATGDKVELDAHGHPWSADLHSPTKSKTTAGLWRMKVGASRPDPAPGYPKPLLDL